MMLGRPFLGRGMTMRGPSFLRRGRGRIVGALQCRGRRGAMLEDWVVLCSNSMLSSIFTNETSACSSDLSSLGFSSNDIFTIISAVQVYYPTARSLVCLQNSTSHNLCIADAFDALATARSGVGTLSENNPMSTVSNGIGANVSASVIPQPLICANCTKAARYDFLQERYGWYDTVDCCGNCEGIGACELEQQRRDGQLARQVAR
ncbi:hypothetical protein PENSPDRAFT_199252 [Peniophora sp. CONT]|nr:hypothetical protein PENSPDRAFT_199252 [Peniophora sp. CONT]